MKRVINAAGYSAEARALDHNFYVRDEAGKLHGPYFDALDCRFGDEQLLFVKEKPGKDYYLLDENCQIKKGYHYNNIIGKVFGKYILVKDEDKYFLLNQELKKCSEGFDEVYKDKSYDKFLTVKQNGEMFHLYPNLKKVGAEDEIVEISNDNEEQNTEEVIEYFSTKSNDDTMYWCLEDALSRHWCYLGEDGKCVSTFVGAGIGGIGAITALVMGMVFRFANISEATKEALVLAIPWCFYGGLGLGAGFVSGVIPKIFCAVANAVDSVRVGIKREILNAWYDPENVEKRNIKKIAKNNKEMERIGKRLERLGKRREALQQEYEAFQSERQERLTARRDALLERAKMIDGKIKAKAGDFVSDAREDRQLEKMEQKAGKKSKKLDAKQAEIDKLRKELEELEIENGIRKAEYVVVTREKAGKTENQLAKIDKARDERPLLDELVELEDGVKE